MSKDKGKQSKNHISFAGKMMRKRDFQEMLMHMHPDERVYSLSKIRTEQVVNTLMEQVEKAQQKCAELGPLEMLTEPSEEEQETYLNHRALFNEWNELLDEDSEGCGEEYLEDGVAYWVASFHLKQLLLKKQVSNFWKEQE